MLFVRYVIVTMLFVRYINVTTVVVAILTIFIDHHYHLPGIISMAQANILLVILATLLLKHDLIKGVRQGKKRHLRTTIVNN